MTTVIERAKNKLGNRILTILETVALQEYIEKLETALSAAAQEAFENEVIDTQMTDNVIGSNCEFSSKEEWIDSKIKDWTGENQLDEDWSSDNHRLSESTSFK